MRFLACLIPCVLSASAATYLMWKNGESNPSECAECAELGFEVTADAINQCMVKVPHYCGYSVFAINVVQVTTLCPSNLGFSFEDFTAALPSATALEMRGLVEMQLENATSTCELTYHLSATEKCVSSPTGPSGTITATDGLLELDLSTLKTPLKFINFVASGPECGTKFVKATYDAAAGLEVTGMKEKAKVTP